MRSALNATLPAAERHETERALGAGEPRLPAAVARAAWCASRCASLLTSSPRPVTLLAVDEAHLVSEWGFDFRPDYLALAEVRHLVGDPTVVALTATAPPQVQREVIERLDMHDPAVVVAGFDRPNITLAVHSWHGTKTSDKATADALVVDEVQGGEPARAGVRPHPQAHREGSRRRCATKGWRPRTTTRASAAPTARRCRTRSCRTGSTWWWPPARSAWASTSPTSAPSSTPVRRAASTSTTRSSAGPGATATRRPRCWSTAPRTCGCRSLFAAGSKVKGASVDKVLAVLARTEQEIPLADLAERAELGVRQAQRVLDRLADTGVVEPARRRRRAAARVGGDVARPGQQGRARGRAPPPGRAGQPDRGDAALRGGHPLPSRRACSATSASRTTRRARRATTTTASCSTSLRSSRAASTPTWPANPCGTRSSVPAPYSRSTSTSLVVAFDEVGYKTLTPMVLELGLLAEA
nr:hypothetical protein [Angustibacter aerolatus]